MVFKVEIGGNWPGWSGEEDGNLKGLQRDRLQTDRLRANGDQKKTCQAVSYQRNIIDLHDMTVHES